MNKFMNLAIGISVLALASQAMAESKYVTHATASQIILDAKKDVHQVTAYQVTSDKAGSLLKFYGKATLTDYGVVKTKPNGTQVTLALEDTSAFAINDSVLIQGVGITTTIKTVTGVSTSTGLTFADAPPQAPVGSKVYKLTQIYTVPIGAASADKQGECVVKTLGDSPLVVTLDSTSAGIVAITTK